MNGIDGTFFNCPLTLCYLQFGIPIYSCRLLSFFRLLVFLLSFVPTFLSLSLSFFLSVFLIRLLGFSSRTFLGLVPFFLLLFLSLYLSSSCLFLCCSLFPLWTLSSGRVSICCCNLRPRESVSLRTKASVRNLDVLDGYQSYRRKIGLI